MPRHHNAESPPWEPLICLPNYVTLCKTYEVHYSMWGSHSAVHWWEFKSSEMLHSVTECALPAFCWTTVPSLWGSGNPGRKLNPEDRGPTIVENVSNYTHHDTASHVTLHSWRSKPWYKTSSVIDIIANLKIHIFWVAALTNSIIDSLLFQPTNCLLLQGLRSY